MKGQAIRLLELILPWVAFWAFMVWVFPPKGITQGVASYGDPLEILWSVERHCQALAEGKWFLRTPDVLYPFGLDMRLYPHWLGINLLFTPFCPLSNRVAALNGLGIAAVTGIFAGAFSMASKSFHLPRAVSFLVALSLSFYPLQFFQTCEHLNKLVGLLALTWLWVTLLRVVGAPSPLPWQWGFLSGFLWGVAILFSLYFFWIGLLLVVALLGSRLWKERRFSLALGVGAAIIGLPWGGIFVQALRETPTPFPFHDLIFYAASPDIWPLPSVYHLWWGKAVLSYLNYKALEGNLAMLGPLPFALGLAGFFLALRQKHPLLSRLSYPTLIGLCLSMGIYLKWQGQPVYAPWAEPVHRLFWRIGHFLKPALFPTPEPPPWLADVIPLPGFLWILLPFAEGGRAMVRYLFIAAPGIYLAAGHFLSRLPRLWMTILGVLWATEWVLAPLTWKPLHLHPALEWLAQQPAKGAVFSLDKDGVSWSGRELWGSLFNRHPLIQASGSWIPPHLQAIGTNLLNGPPRFEFAVRQLRQLGMEYLLIQRNGPLAETLYQWASESPHLSPVQCFAPSAQESPWPSEICIFRPQKLSAESCCLIFLDGWSIPEDWGIWAAGERSEVIQWTEEVVRKEIVLELSAFPLCVPQRQQSMEIWVNGHRWKTLRFETCDPIDFREAIPREMVRQYNIISFRYAYAMAPADVPALSGGDSRRLAVGFVRLRIAPPEN